jgi:transitional endoplasmic reticulum ATPase
VLWQDEIDAVASSRSGGLGGDSNVGACDGVVSALLSQLDFAQAGIIIIGATNRPDKIDAALLRPGRLGTLCHVAIPGPKQRLAVLRASLRKAPMDPDLAANLGAVAAATEGFSCADLNAVCERSVKLAVKAAVDAEEELGLRSTPSPLSMAHVEGAMRSARASVSPDEADWFDIVESAIKTGVEIPSKADTAAHAEVPALRTQVADLIEQIKDASRWQRAYSKAKMSAVELVNIRN